MKQKNIQHSAITGGTGNRERVENDFYATPPESTHTLFDNYDFPLNANYLEPCCGQGHISKVIEQRTHNQNTTIQNYDLVDYNYGISGIDATTHTYQNWNVCITNPPFIVAESIISNLIQQSEKGNIICMFLKIQFLEGIKRRHLFDTNPPKEVLVFSQRQSPYRNGNPLDEKGERWSSVMCFCWFIWEVGFTGKPTIKWI